MSWEFDYAAGYGFFGWKSVDSWPFGTHFKLVDTKEHERLAIAAIWQACTFWRTP